MYQPRTYRHWVKDKDLVAFNVVVKETDLYIRAASNLKRKAHKLVLKYREHAGKLYRAPPGFPDLAGAARRRQTTPRAS